MSRTYEELEVAGVYRSRLGRTVLDATTSTPRPQSPPERAVNLGRREVKLPASVFAGGPMRAETEVIEVVIELERTVMVPVAGD